jgi:type I restriction enzyme S subunit
MSQPKTRIRTLAELCRFENGSPFRPEEWSQHGLPIIRIQNLNGGKDFNFFDGDVERHIMVNYGDLLFSWSGNRGTSFGPFRWHGSPGVLNQHIFKLHLSSNVDGAWLFQALRHLTPRIEQDAHGASGLVHIKKSELEKYQLCTPPLAEQRRIAEILDTLDMVIERTEALVQKLKLARVGLLHDLLTRGLDEQGQLRDPQRNPEAFRDSELGRVPREWSIVSIEQVLASPPRNGYSPQESFQPTGTFMLGLGCLTIDGFAPRQIKNAPANDSRIQSFFLKNGDLLLSRANTRTLVAVAGRFEDFGQPCTYPDLMMQLIPNSSIASGFLELLLRFPQVRQQLTRNAQGTSESMVKISSRIVKHAHIPLPNRREQGAIEASYQLALQRQQAEQLQLDKLRQLKRGLMEDLLTGRVRVEAPSEVAQ